MKMKVTLWACSSIFLYSCANVFNGVVLPNQCKKCEVINRLNNEVLFSNEGCGSENTRLEEDAILKAYEFSRNGYSFCDLEVVCESWRKDPEENGE